MIEMIIRRTLFFVLAGGAVYLQGFYKGFGDGWSECADYYGIRKGDHRINFMKDYETFREGIGA